MSEDKIEVVIENIQCSIDYSGQAHTRDIEKLIKAWFELKAENERLRGEVERLKKESGIADDFSDAIDEYIRSTQVGLGSVSCSPRLSELKRQYSEIRRKRKCLVQK